MRSSKKNTAKIILIFIIVITIIGYMIIPKLLKHIYPVKYENTILKYSEEYGLNPYLVIAIIKVESNFNQKALSKKNAIGLMQIREPTGEWIAGKIGIHNFIDEMLYEPEINIRMGCWYINYLTKYYGNNLKLALAAYNGGQGNVDKWLKDKDLSDDGHSLKYIPFDETRHYIKKIEKTYVIYKNIYDKAYIKQMKGMNIIG